MLDLEAINQFEAGITLNLGKISGGGPVNIVPDLAFCQFNVRVSEHKEMAIAQQHIDEVLLRINQLPGFKAKLVGKFTRPPKPATPAQRKLSELVTICARELGMTIQFKATGGCCDGNNLAAAGLVNIDSLGVKGGNIHSHEEYVELDSLSKRAQLSTLLINKLMMQQP